MEIFSEYVVVVVVLICYAIGYIIKNVIPTDEINRFIPLIMGILGVILNVWFHSWEFTPEILLGGLASGLASTGANELIKHLIEGGKNVE